MNGIAELAHQYGDIKKTIKTLESAGQAYTKALRDLARQYKELNKKINAHCNSAEAILNDFGDALTKRQEVDYFAANKMYDRFTDLRDDANVEETESGLDEIVEQMSNLF